MLFLETVSLMSPDPLTDVDWFSDASFNTPSSEFSEKLVNIDLEAHKWEVHPLSPACQGVCTPSINFIFPLDQLFGFSGSAQSLFLSIQCYLSMCWARDRSPN
jgi:hypothetical protein